MITTPQDVQKVRAVAINVADEAIEPYIEDAEKQDIIPVIGADLYFEIEANRDDPKYKELLEGGTYTDCDCAGTQYSRGLIVAVAYLAYSRMLIFGDIQYTAFGAVLKNSQYSQKPGETDKIRAADAAKKMGFAVLQNVAGYIRANGLDTCCTPKRVSRPKYVAIKKDKL